MKIVLFGKDGQLGRSLQRRLAMPGELIALGRDDLQYCGDLRDHAGLRQTILALRPDIVINAAAYTNVDRAEQQSNLANQVNAVAPGVIAAAAQEIGAMMVHYSSDYVFDGAGTRPWRETDTPAPINAYGRSKLVGDQAVVQQCKKPLIFRSSWLYSEQDHNFATTMVRLARERAHLRVVDDQIGVPTLVDWLAEITANLVHRVHERDAGYGLYHAVPSGATSWHGYASYLIEQLRARGIPLRVKQIEAVSTEHGALAKAAPRPLNSRLSSEKIRVVFGLTLPAWQQGVDDLAAAISHHFSPRHEFTQDRA